MVTLPETVSVLADTERTKVCVPAAVPMVRAATEALSSRVTVKVEPRAISTVSVVVGTTPVLQLLAVLQVPLEVLVQVTCPAATKPGAMSSVSMPTT